MCCLPLCAFIFPAENSVTIKILALLSNKLHNLHINLRTRNGRLLIQSTFPENSGTTIETAFVLLLFRNKKT